MSLRFRRVRWYGAALLVSAAGCAGTFPSAPPAAAPALHAVPAASTAAASRASQYDGLLHTTTGSAQTTTTVRQVVRPGSSPDPFGRIAGTSDEHSVETDVTYGQSVTWTADQWHGYGTARSGAAPLNLYALQTVDAGTVATYRYLTPQVLDERPERSGASWSNGSSLELREKLSGGTVSQTHYAADGSYAQTVTYPYGCSSATCELSVAVAPNGAARLSGSELTSQGIEDVTFGAPAGGSIAMSIAYAGGYAQQRTLPAWFAADAPLYAETDRIDGPVTFPASCGVPKGYGSRGNVVVRSFSRVDPAAGYTQTEQTQSYVASSVGTVCVVLSDVLQQYYDYTYATFQGTPLQVVRTQETLTLRSAGSRAAFKAIERGIGGRGWFAGLPNLARARTSTRR